MFSWSLTLTRLCRCVLTHVCTINVLFMPLSSGVWLHSTKTFCVLSLSIYIICFQDSCGHGSWGSRGTRPSARCCTLQPSLGPWFCSWLSDWVFKVGDKILILKKSELKKRVASSGGSNFLLSGVILLEKWNDKEFIQARIWSWFEFFQFLWVY